MSFFQLFQIISHFYFVYQVPCENSNKGVGSDGIRCQWPTSHLENCDKWAFNCKNDPNMKRCCKKACGLCPKGKCINVVKLSHTYHFINFKTITHKLK